MKILVLIRFITKIIKIHKKIKDKSFQKENITYNFDKNRYNNSFYIDNAEKVNAEKVNKLN